MVSLSSYTFWNLSQPLQINLWVSLNILEGKQIGLCSVILDSYIYRVLCDFSEVGVTMKCNSSLFVFQVLYLDNIPYISQYLCCTASAFVKVPYLTAHSCIHFYSKSFSEQTKLLFYIWCLNHLCHDYECLELSTRTVIFFYCLASKMLL